MNREEFDESVNKVKLAIALTGAMLEPEGNWSPVLLLARGDNLYPFHLPLADEADKETVAARVTKAVAAFRPEFAAVVVMGWQRILDANDPRTKAAIDRMSREGVRNDPLREEMILLKAHDGE